jgi:branched-chain amino acid transport system substrate-binding protein
LSVIPLIGALLLTSACGTRLDHARMLADNRAGSGGGAATHSAATAPVAGAAPVAAPVAAAGGAPTATAPGAGTTAPTVPPAAVTGVNSPAPAAGQQSNSAAATSSGTNPGASVPVAAHACTGQEPPVVIGTVGEQSGVFGGFIGGGPRAVQAWAQMVNARGGLNCHPVKYVVADDGGDPSRHQSLVKQLVEQDHVIAIVQSDAPLTGQSSVQYLVAKGIPVIGNEGGEPWSYENPTYFPQATNSAPLVIASIAGAADVAKARGITDIGEFNCIEAPACSSFYPKFREYAPKFGLNLVYGAQVSLTLPDYTAQCQGAKQAGARVLFMGLDGNSQSRVARSCKGVGYSPIYTSTSSAVVLGLADDPNLNGITFTLQVLPWMITSNPRVQEYRAALAKYAPSQPPDGASIIGWTSAKLFEAAAAASGGTPTSAGLLKALWSMKGNTLGGLTYPLTYAKGKNAPQTMCYWLVQIKDGAFLSPDNGKMRCVS